MRETTAIERRQLVGHLLRKLSHRWLREPGLTLTILKQLVGRKASWMQRLDEAVHSRFSHEGYADYKTLSRWIARSPILKKVFENRKTIRVLSKPFSESPSRQGGRANSPREYRWDTPPAETEAELIEMLCLTSHRALDWLLKPHVRRVTKVDHYRRMASHKRNGSVRWIEEPRPLLKRVQRCIAKHFLSPIPVHDAAHAFCAQRSTNSCAAPHVGKAIVLRMDLSDFFGSIHLSRVTAFFRVCGYERDIAFSLARLCTAPAIIDSSLPAGSPLLSTRLPQGAPTSPALANLISYRLDTRLAGLAASLDVTYTRYCDDLFFSGNESLAVSASRFASTVAVIAMEEGFSINHRKTRRMYQGHQQHMLGLTVNDRLATDRRDFETLKAILHNCKSKGWHSQNRDDHPNFQMHLRGRIEHVGQSHRGRRDRLLKLFNAIDW